VIIYVKSDWRAEILFLYNPSRVKQGGSLEFLYRDRTKTARRHVCVTPYVPSLSSHTRGASNLKIGMHIPQIDSSKVTYQIFDILPINWDICEFKVL